MSNSRKRKMHSSHETDDDDNDHQEQEFHEKMAKMEMELRESKQLCIIKELEKKALQSDFEKQKLMTEHIELKAKVARMEQEQQQRKHNQQKEREECAFVDQIKQIQNDQKTMLELLGQMAKTHCQQEEKSKTINVEQFETILGRIGEMEKKQQQHFDQLTMNHTHKGTTRTEQQIEQTAAVASAKVPPSWKIPKKTSNKKGSSSESVGKANKDSHNNNNSTVQQSESAAKGGYNGVNIDGLFGEIEQQRTTADNASSRKENGSEVAVSENNSGAQLQISRGAPQQPNDNNQSPDFFGSLKSSTLGLALYKAEKEGRDSLSRHLRSGHSPQNMPNVPTEDFRNDFLSRVRERDRQLEQRRKK